MNRLCALLVVAAAAGAACNRSDRSTGENSNQPGQFGEASADNTKRNERDRNVNALTPGDQEENEADRTLTQRVRQEVVKQDALSMTAKNVKIITRNGVVTLRGPVRSEEERSQIARIAQSVGGVGRVDNQLEIASN